MKCFKLKDTVETANYMFGLISMGIFNVTKLIF